MFEILSLHIPNLVITFFKKFIIKKEGRKEKKKVGREEVRK